jgi:hypothetical protein
LRVLQDVAFSSQLCPPLHVPFGMLNLKHQHSKCLNQERKNVCSETLQDI